MFNRFGMRYCKSIQNEINPQSNGIVRDRVMRRSENIFHLRIGHKPMKNGYICFHE